MAETLHPVGRFEICLTKPTKSNYSITINTYSSSKAVMSYCCSVLIVLLQLALAQRKSWHINKHLIRKKICSKFMGVADIRQTHISYFF